MQHYITFALISILSCSPCFAKQTQNQKKHSNQCHTSYSKILPALAISFGLGLFAAKEIDKRTEGQDQIHASPVISHEDPDETHPQPLSRFNEKIEPDNSRSNEP